MAVRLFVGNLPYDTTELELREHFAPVGRAQQVFVPVDRETGRPRGFAFVEFTDREEAEEAIRRFDGQLFKGRPLAVSEARAREDKGPGPRPAGPYSPSRTRPAVGDPGLVRDRGGVLPSPPPRRPRGPVNKRARVERPPRGPIRERTGGRLFDVDDGSPEEDLEFDNFAVRAPEPDTEDEPER